MVETIKRVNIKADGVTYIPMHRRKQAKRGYNQARLLSLYISKSLDIDLIDNNLIKHKNTKDQSHSDKNARNSNLIDCFSIKDPSKVKNAHILLVDDIITTGATMREASRVLMDNGAKKVTGFALTSSKKC